MGKVAVDMLKRIAGKLFYAVVCDYDMRAMIDIPWLNGETVKVGYVCSDETNWELCTLLGC